MLMIYIYIYTSVYIYIHTHAAPHISVAVLLGLSHLSKALGLGDGVLGSTFLGFGVPYFIVNPRKLEHRFRMIHAGIPFSLL